MSSYPSSTCATDGSAKSSHSSSRTSSSHPKRKSKNKSHPRTEPTTKSSSKPDTNQQQDVDVSNSHLAAEQVDEAFPPLTSALLALIPDTSHERDYTLKPASEEPNLFYSATYISAEDRTQAHLTTIGTQIYDLNARIYQEQEK